MKRILICLILAFSLVGLCACGETEQERAARRLEEANRALTASRKAAEQAMQDLNEFESMWAGYQDKRRELERARP